MNSPTLPRSTKGPGFARLLRRGIRGLRFVLLTLLALSGHAAAQGQMRPNAVFVSEGHTGSRVLEVPVTLVGPAQSTLTIVATIDRSLPILCDERCAAFVCVASDDGPPVIIAASLASAGTLVTPAVAAGPQASAQRSIRGCASCPGGPARR